MNGGMSNVEIFNYIAKGMETSSPQINHTLDIKVKLYESAENVLGRAYPSSAWQEINIKYFHTNSDAECASNLMHEWLHRCTRKFDHEAKRTALRIHCVPYAVGYIVLDLCRVILKEDEKRAA